MPGGIRGKRFPDFLAMGPISIGQHPDQRVRVVQTLPDSDNLGAMLLKNGHLLLTEPLVQVINAALTIHCRLSRVHAKLKTARTGINIFAEILRQIGRRAAGFRILLRGRWQGDK